MARAIGLLVGAVVMVLVLAPAGALAAPYGAATWGENLDGDLGAGTAIGPELCFRSTSCSTTPVGVAKLSDPVALGAGEDFECAVISGGRIECWGRNDAGDLGDGTEEGPEECPLPTPAKPCSRTPVRVGGITNATAVVAGVGFACALLETHSIDCWGFGTEGELGDGKFETSLTPVQVSGITDATSIAAGEVDACAVLKTHAVECWGDGRDGALGNGGTESKSTPVKVSGITSAVRLAAGNSDACAVLEGGEVECWGRNGRGDLGDGKNGKEQEFSSVPVAVGGITTASAVTADLEHACAQLKSGGVDCWGDDEFGDLGDGHSFEESPKPVAVTGISTATQIAAGYYHTCAVLSSGGVDCWGDNSFGELGDGKTFVEQEESSTPVAVSGITDATGIAAYESITVAFGPSFPVGKPLPEPTPEELFGLKNPGEPGYCPICEGDPVNSATGNLVESQTDLAVSGRGIPLTLTRTYNAQAAAAGKHGSFGYGWSGSFSDRLEFDSQAKTVTVVQANGSTVTFSSTGEPGELKAPKWAQAKLVLGGGGTYTNTLPDQDTFSFNKEGQLLSESDRDGNTTTLAYGETGRLESITDSSGREIKLKYNSEGLVESVEDPMGHVVKYTYEGGNLKSVTQPGEASLRWQFGYNGEHELTEMVDGRGGKTINEYNSSHQVTKQEDPAGHKLEYEYKLFHTKITNESTGSVTSEFFTSSEEPESITRGYGTASATTASFAYNEAGEVTDAFDGNGHLTSYTYDGEGNRTSETNPEGDETKWTYDSTHDLLTMTSPKGETTTIKRGSHGNPEVIERPAPGGRKQITKHKYNSLGELESLTDPLERTWKYEYDTYGDRVAEVDPASDRRTWKYNGDSQEIATVSPRGNIKAGEESKYTIKTARDAQGRPLTITNPLGHTTKYSYDGDGNVESITDGNAHTTTYTYNGDNEQTKAEEPNKTITETGYDGAGQIIAQTSGGKHTTKYGRNALEQAVKTIDALGRMTTKEYDKAGNLTKVTDAENRTTTYTYDHANRLTEVVYSSGNPATIKYEYDKDGERTKMTDGTGTTTYAYDQLDRLTRSENGHKESIEYEYDLANEQTKLTYPNGNEAKRSYDKDGRLEKVTDWLENTTQFAYNANSELNRTTFPASTEDVDKYEYNQADQMSSQTMARGTTKLASYGYGHDNDNQVNAITNHNGEAGAEKTAYEYDANNRLTKVAGATVYEYNADNDPTKINSGAYSYNAADELEKGAGVTYAYNEEGQRTKTTPEKGPAATYGYNQAGELTSVERPEGEGSPKIEDAYAYNGEGLRASQTISGTTSNFAWNATEGVPLVLSDGTNSYIYGPGGIPLEQINNSQGKALYLHHDQQGSTRLLTNSTGKVEGGCSYSPYGTSTCEGAATTPLGFDGQYTNSDTGLIYLRAREYDPSTAQFLSVDPAEPITRAPYTYASDNPLNHSDPTGLGEWEPWTESFWTEENFISNSPLNPIPYYEEEIESYENGCPYLTAVAHGLEGAVAGAALFAGGEGADEADITVADVLKGKLGKITRAPLPPGSPSWADIQQMTIAEIRAAAKANEPGYRTILKLLTEGKYNKP